ncbi:MAG TPA: 2Fe-2S iron-sulfur cluster binding domain-containing protein [Methylibium sp.]|nr:2Fe-2S iron-sulfur cluster binding domain-containing protein [Methylibium sp.]
MRGIIKSLFGGPKVRPVVEIRPQGVRIELSTGETILQAALAQGVAYPHNCTVGTCGSCKTHLVEGQIKALSDFGYTLSKEELEAGYILACQSVPRDPLTVVEIADLGADLPPPETCTGRIVATKPLTHDIVKMVVETDRPVRFVAGQYATFRTPELNDRGRNYSFAEAPQRAGSRTLAFFVRKVPGGRFTESLFAGQLAGQTLTLEAPHGSFRLRPGHADMVCVAGGSGLAPLISVLEDMRMRRVRRACTLLFGARTQADLYALDQIEGLAGGWLERFSFVPVLSHEPADSGWTGARGWVTDHIASAAGTTAWDQAEGYMCGPPPMIDAGMARLRELGMPLEHIHYDKFTEGPAPVAPAAVDAGAV